MTKRHAYSYAVLRYVHDVMTGEFVNVGVVLHSKGAGFLRAKVRTTHARLSAVFPDLDGLTLRTTLRRLARAIDRRAAPNAKCGTLCETDLGPIIRSVLPEDDSSLQWSPIGSGLTDDLEMTLGRLFERMVIRYDERPKPRRLDEEIWRPVREILQERQIVVPFEEKTIRSKVDQVQFKHAWKNGVWHCYEPLSFDLAGPDSIRDKAHRWAGRLIGVTDATEEFKPYFIVGRPQEAGLEDAFQTALSVLKMSPHDPEIFIEEDAAKLVDRIESEATRHNAFAGPPAPRKPA